MVQSLAARPGRVVSLVLATPQDGVLGVLPPFPVPTPFWQEAGEVVGAARERFGVGVVVLRLLRAERESPSDGGAVVYLAQVTGPVPTRAARLLEPWDDEPLAPHPARAAYADLDGPQADLERAAALLAVAGRSITGPPQQQRTWNLSSIWCLPTDGGPVWLKSVPPMFGHEPGLLEWLHRAGAPVPEVLGTWTTPRGAGVLLAEVPGPDHYGAPAPVVTTIAERLIDLQAGAAGDVSLLARLGVPDGRDATLIRSAQALLPTLADELTAEERAAADRLVADLPRRLASIAGCGLPVTLVHGDAHPGNARGPVQAPTLLDWGDSRIGGPARDLAHLVAQLEDEDAEQVLATATARWRRFVPGSDGARATGLAGPLDALAAAVAWQGFLDRIEPDERPYHEGDPAAGVREAIRAARWS